MQMHKRTKHNKVYMVKAVSIRPTTTTTITTTTTTLRTREHGCEPSGGGNVYLSDNLSATRRSVEDNGVR